MTATVEFTPGLAGETLWKPLRIGAGGYCTGIHCYPDGTKVCRADQAGAWIWDDSIVSADNADMGEWRWLATMKTFPAGAIGPNIGRSGSYCYEVACAPSNTDRIYYVNFGEVYRSDDRGFHFVKKSPPPQDWDQYITRAGGPKMAVDPANPDIVVFGALNSPLFISRDAGESWIGADVPYSDELWGHRVVFDPSSAVVDGATQGIYVTIGGSGVYHSTDGGETFTQISSTINEAHALDIDSDGRLYIVDAADLASCKLWKRDGGAWTELLAASGGNLLFCIAVNRTDESHLVAMYSSGGFRSSYDYGATWSDAGEGDQPHDSTGDIPWLSWTHEAYFSAGFLTFEYDTDKLWHAQGIGIWWADAPVGGATTITWHSQSRGIEELVSQYLMKPPGGGVVYSAGDRGIFVIDDPNVFPTQHHPDPGPPAIMAGWGSDYAENDPSFLVCVANYWGVDKSCYSTDYGATWTVFDTIPDPIMADGKIGGNLVAVSTTNFVWLGANQMIAPWWTKDGGETWFESAISGTYNPAGWGPAMFNKSMRIVNDKETGAVYMYNSGSIYHTLDDPNAGIFKSMDGGETFTKIFDGRISLGNQAYMRIRTVPGHAGHLFFAGGYVARDGNLPDGTQPGMRSTDHGVTWAPITDVTEAYDIAIGKEAPGGSYPCVYLYGWVGETLSFWRSEDNCETWINIGSYPADRPDRVDVMAADPDVYGSIYVGFGGCGCAYGQFVG